MIKLVVGLIIGFLFLLTLGSVVGIIVVRKIQRGELVVNVVPVSLKRLSVLMVVDIVFIGLSIALLFLAGALSEIKGLSQLTFGIYDFMIILLGLFLSALTINYFKNYPKLLEKIAIVYLVFYIAIGVLGNEVASATFQIAFVVVLFYLALTSSQEESSLTSEKDIDMDPLVTRIIYYALLLFLGISIMLFVLSLLILGQAG